MLREIKTSKLIKEWFLDISTVLHTYNILWLEPVLRKLWQPPGHQLPTCTQIMCISNSERSSSNRKCTGTTATFVGIG
jgi:hypothetical protein